METDKTAVLCCYFCTLGALYRIRLVASLCHGILKAVKTFHCKQFLFFHVCGKCNCILLVGTLNFSG